MTFAEIIEKLRDGKRYAFTHKNLDGYFHKAPYPSLAVDEAIDSACSAITFVPRTASPTQSEGRLVMLLDDFDRDDWELLELSTRPRLDQSPWL